MGVPCLPWCMCCFSALGGGSKPRQSAKTQFQSTLPKGSDFSLRLFPVLAQISIHVVTHDPVKHHLKVSKAYRANPMVVVLCCISLMQVSICIGKFFPTKFTVVMLPLRSARPPGSMNERLSLQIVFLIPQSPVIGRRHIGITCFMEFHSYSQNCKHRLRDKAIPGPDINLVNHFLHFAANTPSSRTYLLP